MQTQKRDIFYHALAQAHYAQQRWQQAEQVLRQALQYNAQDHVAWSELGFVHAKQDKHEHAVDDYKKALALKHTPQTQERLAKSLKTLQGVFI